MIKQNNSPNNGPAQISPLEQPACDIWFNKKNRLQQLFLTFSPPSPRPIFLGRVPRVDLGRWKILGIFWQRSRNSEGVIWVFPKIGVPPNHLFWIRFSFVNHPFWGTPIFRKHPYTLPKTNSSPFKNGAWETTFLLRRPVFQERPVRLLVPGRV